LKKVFAIIVCLALSLSLTGCALLDLLAPPPPPPPHHPGAPPPLPQNQPPVDLRAKLQNIRNGQGNANGLVIAGSGQTDQKILTDYGTFTSQPFLVKDGNGKTWIVLLQKPADENLLGKTVSVTGEVVNKTDYPPILKSNPSVPENAIVNAEIIK